MPPDKPEHFVLYRIPTVTRITLTRELERQFERLRARGTGIMLDVGAKGAPYQDHFAAERYMTLDIDPAVEPDLCCDLHDITWEADYFDTVLATEVLEHLSDPQHAINEMHRILKPGGVCLLSTRFIYQYHADPQDYYRYTHDALNYLLRDFSNVEVIPHGNRLLAAWQLITSSKRTLGLLSWLNPFLARFEQADTQCPLGYVVWAEK